MGSAGCNLLWAAQSEWDYHGGSLSTAIDAFESIPKRKTAAIRAETLQSDFVNLFRDPLSWNRIGIEEFFHFSNDFEIVCKVKSVITCEICT